jgi:hypothetical protein
MGPLRPPSSSGSIAQSLMFGTASVAIVQIARRWLGVPYKSHEETSLWKDRPKSVAGIESSHGTMLGHRDKRTKIPLKPMMGLNEWLVWILRTK